MTRVVAGSRTCRTAPPRWSGPRRRLTSARRSSGWSTPLGHPTLAADVLRDDDVVAGAQRPARRAAARAPRSRRRSTSRSCDRRRPAEALVDLSLDADLLVVGTHRMTASERVFSGSLAYQIAAASRPRGGGARAGRAGLGGRGGGGDGSADSVAAVALAAAEADRIGEPLYVVHAWTEPAIYAPTDAVRSPTAEGVREAEPWCSASPSQASPSSTRTSSCTRSLVHDQPATALLDAAELPPARGRQPRTPRADSGLLGSVSHTVVLHAPCPVMVARTVMWPCRTTEAGALLAGTRRVSAARSTVQTTHRQSRGVR